MAVVAGSSSSGRPRPNTAPTPRCRQRRDRMLGPLTRRLQQTERCARKNQNYAEQGPGRVAARVLSAPVFAASSLAAPFPPGAGHRQGDRHGA